MPMNAFSVFMLNTRRLWMGIIVFFSVIGFLHAETQPKFTIIPTTATTLNMQDNEVRTVRYTVTNMTKITRTLTMVPISAGIIQTSNAAGDCANPFTLAQNQSCSLQLTINGSKLSGKQITSPVEVCKTNEGPDNNTPDKFLCSQTAQSNNLNITVNPTANISISPTILRLTTVNSSGGPSGQITVTNNSSVTAYNIRADLSRATTLSGNVQQDSTNCQILAAGSSCQLIFKPLAQPVSLVWFPISGSNTTVKPAAIVITAVNIAEITALNYLTLYVDGSSEPLTITNNSPTVTAAYITAQLPFYLIAAGVRVDYNISNCTSVQPTENCSLYFTPGTFPVIASPVLIQGINTSLTSTTISVEQTPAVLTITAPSPPSLDLLFGGAPPQTMTIENASTTQSVSDIHADFVGTALNGSVYESATTCHGPIFAGDSCQLTFSLTSGASTVIPPTLFPIRGMASSSGTTTVYGTISVGSNLAYTANLGKNIDSNNASINRCMVSRSSSSYGQLTDCTDVATQDSHGKYIPNPVGLAIDSTNNYIYIANTYGPGANPTQGFVSKCTITPSTGKLSSCSKTGYLNAPIGLALSDDLTSLYVTSGTASNTIYMCSTSDMLSCGYSSTANSYGNPTTTNNYGIAVNSSYAYLVSGGGMSSPYYISQCSFGGKGALRDCFPTPSGGGLGENSFQIIVTSSNAYVTNSNSTDVLQCPISGGSIRSCVNSGATFTGNPPGALGIVINNTNTIAYIVENDEQVIMLCAVGSGGALGSCVNSEASNLHYPKGIALWEAPTS